MSQHHESPIVTTQSTLAQPHSEDYSHIEPLPDPPREPDMVQRKSLSTIDGTLGSHLAAFSDVLLTREIYVRLDEEDARELGSRLHLRKAGQ